MLNKFTIRESFAISAGAGSGKTYTLSRRYVNALLGFDYFREDYDIHKNHFEDLNPAKVNEIVTITYTEAAALEMKSRIFSLVNQIINYEKAWIIEKSKRQNESYKKDDDFESIQKANANIGPTEKEYLQKTLKQAYTDSSNAKISTIHAYCLDIIKANADIAKIDTKLDIIKDDEKQKELATIIFDVLNSESNRKLVLDISKDVSMFFLNNLINSYVSNTKFRSDYDNFKADSIDVVTYKELIHELYPLPEINDALTELQDDPVRLKWFQDFYNGFVHFNAVSWKEIDLNVKAPSMGAKKFPESDSLKKELEKILNSLVYTNIDMKKENLFFTKIEEIKELLHQIKNAYDVRLLELGKIDFDTIITKTLEIIPKIKTPFKYIMVDEFQDTNITQFEIVKESRNADTNLFVVGDSKQSIYSFQGAEIEVFNSAIQDKTLFKTVEPMNQNYRSDEIILDRVNKIFQELLKPNEHLKLISANYEAVAQDLHTKNKGGSFKYLITAKEYQTKGEKEISNDRNELDTIAAFVSELYHSKRDEYKHISKLIQSQKKAIAIIFDSSTKMLELKQKLSAKGITAKVSASDNFYHTKEINDIFNTLKAIDIISRDIQELNATQRYYVVGALRSNILRCDDNAIKKYLDAGKVSEKLLHYVNISKKMTLSQTVKYIYDDSNLMGVYAHYEDVEQREVNLNKFLMLCRDYEASNESSLYKFLSLIENAIYFSEAEDDEAFFKSDSTKSIEICSIHSTKGLAYPLVLLGNSDKGLYSQITSDAFKHNSFTLNGEKKEIVGFKINEYIPLSHRVLKEIDKLKHLAEKKRLLYVALTRAEHDVIISTELKMNKGGDISLRKDSYLHMICDALEIDKDELYGQNKDYCIKVNTNENIEVNKKSVTYRDHVFKNLQFESTTPISATTHNETTSDNSVAADLGTVTHKIIEFYWDSFKDNSNMILNKMMIFDKTQREIIKKNMQTFYRSEIYTLLKNGVDHHFELEFNVDGKTGFIDFIYFNKEQDGWVIIDFKTGKESHKKNEQYKNQLEFYTHAISLLGYKVVNAQLLWLS